MKLFLDTADIDEIRTVARWGVLDGVTTNPTLFAKTSGMTYDEVLEARSAGSRAARSRPRSSPTTSTGCSRKAATSRRSPTTSSSRSRCRRPAWRRSAASRAEGIRTNCTLIFTRQPGAPRGQGRRVAPLAVRRSPRRHQRGRHDRHPRAGRDHPLPRARLRGPRPPRSGIPATSPRPPSPARTSRRCRSRSSSRWSTTR